MASQQSNPANAKLPLIDTVKFAYASYVENFADVIRCTWLWLLLVVPLLSYASWLRFNAIAKIFSAKTTRIEPASLVPQTGQLALSVFTQILLMIALTSIAVAWHRRIILNETPPAFGTSILTSSFWRYIGVGIVIFLVVGIAFSIFLGSVLLYNWSINPDGNPFPTGGGLPLLAAMAFALWFFAIWGLFKLSPLLPARAAGHNNWTLKDAWRRTAGSTLRIIVGLLLCAIPALIVQLIHLSVVGVPKIGTTDLEGFALRWSIANGLALGANLLILPISIGFLSQAYLFLFDPKREQRP